MEIRHPKDWSVFMVQEKKRKLPKDAGSGQIVSKEKLKENPKTTYEQTIAPKPKPKPRNSKKKKDSK